MMAPEEMKGICMAMALAPAARGRDYINIANEPVFIAYRMMMEYITRELNWGSTFDDSTTYNEDALVVLEWLNERYPER